MQAGRQGGREEGMQEGRKAGRNACREAGRKAGMQAGMKEGKKAGTRVYGHRSLLRPVFVRYSYSYSQFFSRAGFGTVRLYEYEYLAADYR